MTVALFDPSIASGNIGDEIILDSVRRELRMLLPGEHVVSIPTQERITGISIRTVNRATLRIVGGTNLLSSRMLRYRQWQIGLAQAVRMRKVVLMGVGWWQYQSAPDLYTRMLLRRLLSPDLVHSVRDDYTRGKLLCMGVANVLNTGCPTMWRLTPEHCRHLPVRKAPEVVLTLTDYCTDPARDGALIEHLQRHYAVVHFWPQGAGDIPYVRALGARNLTFVQPDLRSYDELLTGIEEIDFVGTRLHGGIRAMQCKRRALILAVDNRAREIGADTGLPVAERGDLRGIADWIEQPRATEIRMNWPAIERWRAQFSS